VRIAAQLTNAGSGNARRASRMSVKASAAYREGGDRGKVDVVDLSPTGAKIESHLTLYPDTHIWLKLPSLEAWEARIAWVDRHQAGCEFVRPLHPAVFDRIVTMCRTAQSV
jgi:hypothetical protein